MKKIAIIGAGISGLFLANLLEKDNSFSYRIFEKKPLLDLNDGYGIQLSVNSINLLNKVGFQKLSSSEMYFPKKVNFFDAKDLKKICDIDLDQFNFENNKYTTLKRSKLIEFLLKNIPKEKIIFNSNPIDIDEHEKLRLSFRDNSQEEFDYLVAADGVYSRTKEILYKKEGLPKYFNSIALRGNIQSFENKDISLYLGPKFHFVIYPINQNNEFNFISILKRKLNKEELSDNDFFKNNKFLKSLSDQIYEKSSLDLKGKLENIKSFPIFVSKSFEILKHKNIFFVGDALYSFSPSFAQGASQSIESSQEAFDIINSNSSSYYEKRKKRIKEVNFRSKLNYFAFHLSNPIAIFLRNIVLKLLVKNRKFLENYLGRIYKN